MKWGIVFANGAFRGKLCEILSRLLLQIFPVAQTQTSRSPIMFYLVTSLTKTRRFQKFDCKSQLAHCFRDAPENGSWAPWGSRSPVPEPVSKGTQNNDCYSLFYVPKKLLRDPADFCQVYSELLGRVSLHFFDFRILFVIFSKNLFLILLVIHRIFQIFFIKDYEIVELIWRA